MSLLSFWYRYRAVMRSLARRRSLDREMREEMELHLARAADRHAARGLSPAAARDAARREFGNVAVLQEQGRDARAARWIESVLADLRFALRQIARRPLASATIVGVLALGIGVHAGIISFYQAVRLRPPAGVHPDPALVRLRGKERPPESERWLPREFSYPEYLELAARTDLFSATSAWTTNVVALDFGDPERATSAQMHFVTDKYFVTAGVRMAVGRALTMPARAEGDDGEMVAVISDAMWRALFGATRDVVGRTLKVNDALVRIVGVAPPRFNGLTVSGSERTMWMPLASRATVLRTTRRALVDRDSALLSAAALVAPGVSIERATVAAQLVSEQAVRRMTRDLDRRIRTTDVVPLRGITELPEDPQAVLVPIAFGILGVLVLLVACTNVSALVVGAGIARSQEIAVRLSLGAARARLIRQLLTESCVLAVAGGVAGLALYRAFAFIAANSVVGIEIAPDLATAALTLVIALATGILFGLSPALHATKAGLAEVLKTGGSAGGASARTRLQSSFVVAQIAVTQPLLIGVAVMLALIVRQNERGVEQSVTSRVVEIGFDVRKIAPETRARLHAAMRDLETLPGIERVVSDANGRELLDFTVQADSRAGLLRETPIQIHLEEASAGYFTLLGVPIVRGRDLVAADTTARDRAVLLSTDVAHELWGNADPIGRRFAQSDHGKPLERAAVVVGVYDASRGTTRGPGRRVFAIDNSGWRDFSYLARTVGPARPLIRPMRERLRKTLPDLPVESMETLQDAFAEEERTMMQVGAGIGTAGALVLLLASIGLYGVIALAVAQRRREIGIRIALGAKPVEVVALLFRQGLRLSAVGLVIGLPFSVLGLFAIGRVMVITGDNGALPVNPVAIGGMIALVVVTVAAIATWLPARRAAVVDPMIALRTE
ncbi:MAG TPA: ABC transporter permease [Gemmatimonadaceae bacterium]